MTKAQLIGGFDNGRGAYWVRPGSQFSGRFKVTNNGDGWYPGARYKLGSQGPQDNEIWGFGRIDLDGFLQNVGPVPQGALIDFTATAPTVIGDYRFSWRMVQEGVEWFGTTTNPLVIVSP